MPGVKVTAPIEPARAPVVPRGSVVGTGGEILPLETHIRALAPRKPLIALLGSGGSGKSTAIAHLAHVLADLPIEFCDDPGDVYNITGRGRVLVAALDELPTVVSFDAVLEIAPWGESERIDYLLARHPVQVRSVMERLRDRDWIDWLEGSPRLWATVLQRMAEVPTLVDVPGMLRQVMNVVLSMFGEDAAKTRQLMATAARTNDGRPRGVPAFLRHPFMLRLALVDELVGSIDQMPASVWWQKLWDDDVLDALASRLREDPSAIARLRARIRRSSAAVIGEIGAQGPMMSVILAVDPTFRPSTNVINLDLVRARGVDWSDARLAKVSLCNADLVRANLSGADLSNISATAADLRQANLSGANLSDARLAQARLDEASLPGAVLDNANLRSASAMTANFNGAHLVGTDLCGVDLRGASFCGATLTDASLIDASLAAADFTGAALEATTCLGCDWREAILHDARFHDARLDKAIFAGLQINGLRARLARFVDADLTGSVFRDAMLAGSLFRQAGLADIDWEGADLRDCDFTHAAFHMGTSRSGLVFSPIACEGTRTGFYTHDDLEPYKLPEEIRVANLCGANLVGAKVKGTDWYLVDLRGAKYTVDQAEWFRKCGAILFDRR